MKWQQPPFGQPQQEFTHFCNRVTIPYSGPQLQMYMYFYSKAGGTRPWGNWGWGGGGGVRKSAKAKY